MNVRLSLFLHRRRTFHDAAECAALVRSFVRSFDAFLCYRPSLPFIKQSVVVDSLKLFRTRRRVEPKEICTSIKKLPLVISFRRRHRFCELEHRVGTAVIDRSVLLGGSRAPKSKNVLDESLLFISGEESVFILATRYVNARGVYCIAMRGSTFPAIES